MKLFKPWVGDSEEYCKAMTEYRQALLDRRSEVLDLDERSRAYASGVAERIRSGARPDKPLYVAPVPRAVAPVVNINRRKKP